MRNGQDRGETIASRRTARARRSSGSSAPTRWADVHSPAVRTVRLHRREGKFTPTVCRAGHAAGEQSSTSSIATGLPLDVFVVVVEGSGRHHARVRAHHRAAGDAGAVDARLHAIVIARSRGPDGDPRRRENVQRKETAVRHADLPRHGVHAVGLEHAQRRVYVAPDELSRSRRRCSTNCTPIISRS